MEDHHPGGRGVAVAAGAALGNIVGVGPVLFYVSPLFMPAMTAQFHWSRSFYSGGLLLATLVLSGLQPFIGRAVDRWGVRRVLLPGILCAGLALMAPALTNGSTWLSLALFVVLGAGLAFQTPTAYSKVVAGWFASTRGLMLGLSIGGGLGLGAFLMPRFVAWTISDAGWREAYVGLGLLTMLIGAPAILFLLRDPPQAAAGPDSAAPAEGVTLKAARSNPVFWRLAGAIFLSGAAITAVMVHSMTWFGDRGVPRGTAFMLIGAIGIAQIFGRFLSGVMLDRFNTGLASVPFFLAPLAGVLLADYGAPTPAVLTISGALIGLGLGAETEIGAYLVSRHFGMQHFAAIYGAILAVFSIATAVGPYVMGLTFDLTGSYRWALNGVEFGLLAAAALMSTLGPYAFAAGRRIQSATARPTPSPVRA